MKSIRVLSFLIALCVELVLPGRLFAEADAQAVNQFLANPTQALQQYPNGGPQMISLLRNVAVAHPEALSTITSLLSTANAAQQAAIGSGLGQAAQITVETNQDYAARIQQAIAGSGSNSAQTAFAGVTGNTSIGATGGGGGGGGGGGSGGVGGPSNFAGFGSGGGGGGGSTSLLGGGSGSSFTGGGGTFNTSNGGLTTVTVTGGTVTFNVLTGALEFEDSNGHKTTIGSGNSGQVADGAVTQLMNTAQLLSGDNAHGAFAQTAKQSLLAAISATAALAGSQPDNANVANVLKQLVTQTTQLAASAVPPDTALMANIVAFAVANAPGLESSITEAANNGVQNSTASDKDTLFALVTDSVEQGSQKAVTPTSSTTHSNGQALTTIITPVDPGQVLVVSPSS